MRFRTFLTAIAIASLCTGCVTQTQVNQSATAIPGGAPRTVTLVQRPVRHASFLNKTVLAGQTTAVAYGFAIHSDCTARAEEMTIRITQPPVHGSAEVARRVDYPRFPPSNPNYACNKKRMPGIFVDYTPDDGFTGSDFMAISIFVDGGEIPQKISITVK